MMSSSFQRQQLPASDMNVPRRMMRRGGTANVRKLMEALRRGQFAAFMCFPLRGCRAIGKMDRSGVTRSVKRRLMDEDGSPLLSPALTIRIMVSGSHLSVRHGKDSEILAIIFDADGVVIDSEKLWDFAQEEFSRRHGIVYDREKIKPRLAGTSQTEAIEILKAEYGLYEDTESLTDERMELVKRQFENGVDFMAGFHEFFRRVQPFYKTCIATSMPETLLTVVEDRLGLSQLFGGRVYSLKAVGYRSKPNPDIFLHAARQMGVKPARCLVIEDAPNGVEAARRAGMKCTALATTFNRHVLSHADLVVDSFAQIEL
jgi:HAD superfamily hydrolase (TIGR01549 family)